MAQKFNPLSGQFDTVLDKAIEIKNTPSGNLAATNLQDAVDELQDDIDTIIGGSFFTPLANITLISADIVAGSIDIGVTPTAPSLTRLSVGGVRHLYTIDFTVSGSTLTWDTLGLASILEIGDVLQIEYK